MDSAFSMCYRICQYRTVGINHVGGKKLNKVIRFRCASSRSLRFCHAKNLFLTGPRFKQDIWCWKLSSGACFCSNQVLFINLTQNFIYKFSLRKCFFHKHFLHNFLTSWSALLPKILVSHSPILICIWCTGRRYFLPWYMGSKPTEYVYKLSIKRIWCQRGGG